jgi:hypothetical protein
MNVVVVVVELIEQLLMMLMMTMKDYNLMLNVMMNDVND